MFSRIIGTVAKGEGLGRQLGFPTANLILANKNALKPGVYAARAKIIGEEKIYAAAAHVGTRPTFENLPPTFEVHLLDFKDRDLYGEQIEVVAMKWLREIKKFDSEEELVEAIKQDCERAREIYKES